MIATIYNIYIFLIAIQFYYENVKVHLVAVVLCPMKQVIENGCHPLSLSLSLSLLIYASYVFYF